MGECRPGRLLTVHLAVRTMEAAHHTNCRGLGMPGRSQTDAHPALIQRLCSNPKLWRRRRLSPRMFGTQLALDVGRKKAETEHNTYRNMVLRKSGTRGNQVCSGTHYQMQRATPSKLHQERPVLARHPTQRTLGSLSRAPGEECPVHTCTWLFGWFTMGGLHRPQL